MVRPTHSATSMTPLGVQDHRQFRGLGRQEELTTVVGILSPMHLCLVSGKLELLFAHLDSSDES